MTSPAAFEGGEDEEADENANENTLDVHSAEPSPRERRKEKKRKEKKREERERKGGKNARLVGFTLRTKRNTLGCSDTINPFAKQKQKKKRKKKKERNTRRSFSSSSFYFPTSYYILYIHFFRSSLSIPTAKREPVSE